MEIFYNLEARDSLDTFNEMGTISEQATVPFSFLPPF